MLFHLLVDLSVVTFHIIKRNVPDRISNNKFEEKERKRFIHRKKEFLSNLSITLLQGNPSIFNNLISIKEKKLYVYDNYNNLTIKLEIDFKKLPKFGFANRNENKLKLIYEKS